MPGSKRQQPAASAGFRWQCTVLLHALIISGKPLALAAVHSPWQLPASTGCVQLNDAQSNITALGAGTTYDGIPFLSIIGVVMGVVMLATVLAIIVIYFRYRGTRNPQADREEQAPLTAPSQPSEINSLRSVVRQDTFTEGPQLAANSTRDFVQPFADGADAKQHGTLELTSVDAGDDRLYEADV